MLKRRVPRSRLRMDTMYEIWLRPNRRAIGFGCLPPAAIVALGLWLALDRPDSRHPALLPVGWCLTIGGLLLIGALVLRQTHDRNDAARAVRPAVELLIRTYLPSAPERAGRPKRRARVDAAKSRR